ncbi:hypothetical protein FB563_4375 [Streptomyces puniciscabiei]|uniref:Uncharacterized protein n=1 Tax=Streptomyces puniciscabiei TaxID=164348 RepID=A0A542UJQ8_9ACTN|nr:(2,3-dihydroxybenzoyl)adenylate synthase [Streptomyces puniciscabiei]TQK99306.1 hypothetical protein FB563_4375 [Streptomyces puniciscabiei]
MRGYYGSPGRSAPAFTPDGYHRAGNPARPAPEGDLVVTARMEEVAI